MPPLLLFIIPSTRTNNIIAAGHPLGATRKLIWVCLHLPGALSDEEDEDDPYLPGTGKVITGLYIVGATVARRTSNLQEAKQAYSR